MKAKARKSQEVDVLGQSERLPQTQVLRFVKATDNFIYFDASNQLDLPAVYIKKDKESLKKAIDEKLLEQALEAENVPNLEQKVLEVFTKKLQQAIHLSRKSGLISIGFDQVKFGKNITIVMDEDISDRSKKELQYKAQGLNCPIYILDKGQLEQLLDLANAKVIGLSKGAEYVLDCLKENQALELLEKI